MLQMIVEECSKNGFHIGYHRIERFPVRIGRALDNDIVVADPYIAPHHVIIDRDENGYWMALDLGSENGTFLARNSRIRGTSVLASGDILTIGRTQLRLWSPEHSVPKELPLPARQSRARRILVPFLAVASLIMVSATLFYNQFLDNSSRLKALSIFAGTLPYLFAPLLWAATCACAGYIVRRRADFAPQLIVADCALIGILAVTFASEYFDYLTCSSNVADISQYAGISVITVLLLFVNISIITGAADIRRAAVSIAIGLGIIATVALTDLASRFESSIIPEYSQTLKPPYANVAKSISVERFIQECGSIFERKPAVHTAKQPTE